MTKNRILREVTPFLKFAHILWLNKALKYSFLPRKRSMTLTGLVLIDQFLPDSHQHYLFENYQQMDVYRVPANYF